MVLPSGEIIERKSGTPQGGVISPVISNLFLHYAIDRWMSKNHPRNLWARYADDGAPRRWRFQNTLRCCGQKPW